MHNLYLHQFLSKHWSHRSIVLPRLSEARMMKLLLFCAVLTVIEAQVENPCPNTVTIRNVVYEKNVLRTKVEQACHLAIDHDTSTLFFSYRYDGRFESVYYNLKDRSTGSIPNVDGGYAHAVDNQRQIVYIGGRDGIYKFDYGTKRAVKLQISDKTIWHMFYKDGLYFISYPEENVYVYKDNQVKLVPEFQQTKGMFMAIDNDNNFVYASFGLHIIKDGNDTSLGDYFVNGLNIDINGNVYFSTHDGIYRVKDKEVELEAAIKDCAGFAIEADGTIIYAIRDKVIQLKPTSRMC